MRHRFKVCPKCLLHPVATDSPLWKCPDCSTLWEEEDLSTPEAY